MVDREQPVTINLCGIKIIVDDLSITIDEPHRTTTHIPMTAEDRILLCSAILGRPSIPAGDELQEELRMLRLLHARAEQRAWELEHQLNKLGLGVFDAFGKKKSNHVVADGFFDDGLAVDGLNQMYLMHGDGDDDPEDG